MKVMSILGGSKIGQGPWRPGKRICSFAFLGGCEMDFRQAELVESGTKIMAVSIFGGHKIIVSPGMPVSVSGFSILGGNQAKRSQAKEMPSTSAKGLQINAISILGGFEAKE